MAAYDGLAVYDIMMADAKSENTIAIEQISAAFIKAQMKGVRANDECQ